MNNFMRYVSFAVVAGMLNLGMIEAMAQSTGSAGASGSAGATGSSGAAGAGGAGSAGAGGGGPSPGFGYGGPAVSTASGCGVGLRLPNPAAFADALQGVEEISRKTQTYLEQCDCATQACVADALDKYADALQKVAPRLPQALRALPKIIHQAAQKARVAPTLRAAVKVLRATVVVVQRVVRKAIELMRAPDPDTASVATRGGDLVASTLNAAATVLERADTL